MAAVKIIKKDVYRYIKFIIGGGLSLILNLLLTYVLTEHLGLWHMLSFAIALTVEITLLFIYHSFVTFQKQGHIVLFIIIILFISGLNWVVVYFLTEVFHILYLIAIIIAALGISVINYFLNKKIVFKIE